MPKSPWSARFFLLTLPHSMAYRSLKRVLGETNLERKCRLLFGTCLFLLILGAFIWVDMIAEDLVRDTALQARQTAREKGRAFADMGLLKLHFEKYFNQPDHKDFVKEMINAIDNQQYDYAILSLDDHQLTQPPHKSEFEIMESLVVAMQSSQLDASDWEDGGTPGDSAEPAGEDADAEADVVQPKRPLFRERLLVDKGMYAYYQPVEWKNSCAHCHPLTLRDSGALSAADAGALEQEAPLRVVRVVIPYTESQLAMINWIRAILTAAGITTFFVAMVALYVIVRYVIVKPLKHLRDVSDDISRGKTEMRAEIDTNDEFEELAESFNRMLRHLTDAQADLQKVNSDLDAKVDQLAQLNMRLYEMNRLKSDFLANMSHELRTPLNSIIGFSDVLSGIDALNDKQRRYANNIRKSGQILLEMINDILDLAKVEAGKMDVRISEFKLDAVLHAQCDMVRALTEEKNIDLSVIVPADVPPVRQDQGKVQQILTNLLSNAIKFTPEGGRITVQGDRDPQGRLELTVTDTGVGIAEEDREIIFEKFRQSTSVFGEDGLTREYSGTGLGLSIVKELCKLLGGEISFESELGKGSAFKVTLPWTLEETQSRTTLSDEIDDKIGPLSRPTSLSPPLRASS